MRKYDAYTVEQAFKGISWSELNGWKDGTKGALLLDGEAVLFEVVATDDGGDEAYGLFTVVKVGDQLFKKSGYYRSHYGSEWDGSFDEVKAKEKSVIVYE